VDDAMEAIERDNPALKGVLPKDYARLALDKERLGQLIDLISNIAVGDQASRSKDVLGRVYEYFLSQFASCVVKLLVEMLEPYRGRVYDPCCGSSGMFVQSVEFIHAHASGNGNGGNKGKARTDISIYGQESNYTTWRLARMNLAIRGIDGQIAHGDTFHDDRHPDLKADFILANPPFNVSDWGGERLRDDKRWQFGVPPAGNANFAWVQHMVYHLAPTGAAGFVLGNISLTSETGREDVIRRGLVDSGLVDCVLTLPDRLFYTTPIPAGIWILRRGKAAAQTAGAHGRQILFIDAAKFGTAVTRTHRELSDSDVTRLAQKYHEWRRHSDLYMDEEGFCRSVPIADVIANNYYLLPAAYVNRGHRRAAGGPLLSEVISRPSVEAARVSLERVTDAATALSDALRLVREQAAVLEDEIELQPMTLAEVLERSDERLGEGKEPEVLTCTESGGLVLQRERFAKRVATDDATRYKVVHMGDIVYNPYLLWKGAIDQCWIVEFGITSPAYEVLRVRREFDPTIIGQLITSPEMIRRYDGISFGTVQRRRRAPVERFLELRVNIPVGASLNALSALLNCAQDAQYASRSAERAVKVVIRQLCEKLR
jgi:type I restriction enzyme M protein